MKISGKKGFTLIELLVVVAVIAVAVGFVAGAAASKSTSNLRKAVYAADSMLTKCRVNSMYRADPVYVGFTVEGGSIVAKYYESSEIREEKSIGNSEKIAVSYTIDGEVQTLSQDTPIYITFARLKGGLVLVDEDGSAIDGKCTEIRFTTGNNSYIIEIIPSTGNRTVKAG